MHSTPFVVAQVIVAVLVIGTIVVVATRPKGGE